MRSGFTVIPDGSRAVLVEHDDFSRIKVTDIFRADSIESAGFRRNDVRAASIFCGDIIISEYAPSILPIALFTASSIDLLLILSFVIV